MSKYAPKPGCVSRKPLSERHLRVEQLFLSGKSPSEIAREIGASKSSVSGLLAKVADVRTLERVRRA